MQPGDDQDMGEPGIAERRRIRLGMACVSPVMIAEAMPPVRPGSAAMMRSVIALRSAATATPQRDGPHPPAAAAS